MEIGESLKSSGFIGPVCFNGSVTKIRHFFHLCEIVFQFHDKIVQLP